MMRSPPISTSTDTPVPYTTLFRSNGGVKGRKNMGQRATWDYLALPESNRDQLAELGAQGWELVTVGGADLNRTFYLKRRQLDFRERVTLERSEEHTSELQSLMRTSYAVCCLKKKNSTNRKTY